MENNRDLFHLLKGTVGLNTKTNPRPLNEDERAELSEKVSDSENMLAAFKKSSNNDFAGFASAWKAKSNGHEPLSKISLKAKSRKR